MAEAFVTPTVDTIIDVGTGDFPLKRIDDATLAIIHQDDHHCRLIELLKERKLPDGTTYYEHISTVVFTFFGRVLPDHDLLRGFAVVKHASRAQSEGRACVRAELVAIGQGKPNIITALFSIFGVAGFTKSKLKKSDNQTLYPDCNAKTVDIFRAVIHEVIANGDFDTPELIQQLFRVECAYGLEGLVAWFLRRIGADNLKIKGDKLVAQGLHRYLRAACADIANCSARVKQLLADPSKTVHLVLKAASAGAYSASFDPPSTRLVFVRVGFYATPFVDFDVAIATSEEGFSAYLAEQRHFALDVDASLSFELDPTIERKPAFINNRTRTDRLGKWNCAKLDLSKITLLVCMQSSLFIAALHSYCLAVHGDPYAYLYLKSRKALLSKCVKPAQDALREFLSGRVNVFAAHAGYIASTDAGQNITHSSCEHVAGRLDVHKVRAHRVEHWGMVPDTSQDFAYICTVTPELSIVTDFLHNLMKDTILGRAEVRRVLAEVDRRVQEHAVIATDPTACELAVGDRIMVDGAPGVVTSRPYHKVIGLWKARLDGEDEDGECRRHQMTKQARGRVLTDAAANSPAKRKKF